MKNRISITILICLAAITLAACSSAASYQKVVGTDAVTFTPGESAGSVQSSDGKTLHILDQSDQVPDIITWNYGTAGGEFMGQEVTCFTDSSANIKVLCMADDGGSSYAFAVNGTGEAYPVNQMTASGGSTLAYTSAKAVLSAPDGLDGNAIYVINSDGTGDFYHITDKNELVKWSSNTIAINRWLIYALIIVIVIAIAIQIVLLVLLIRSRKVQTDTDDIDLEIVDLFEERQK